MEIAETIADSVWIAQRNSFGPPREKFSFLLRIPGVRLSRLRVVGDPVQRGSLWTSHARAAMRKEVSGGRFRERKLARQNRRTGPQVVASPREAPNGSADRRGGGARVR